MGAAPPVGHKSGSGSSGGHPAAKCGSYCQKIRTDAKTAANQFRDMASEVQTLSDLVSNGDISGAETFIGLILGIVVSGVGYGLSFVGIGSWVWSHLLQDYKSVLLQMASDYDQLASQFTDTKRWVGDDINNFNDGEEGNLSQREGDMRWHEIAWSFISQPAVGLFQGFVGVMDARGVIDIESARFQMLQDCVDTALIC